MDLIVLVVILKLGVFVCIFAGIRFRFPILRLLALQVADLDMLFVAVDSDRIPVRAVIFNPGIHRWAAKRRSVSYTHLTLPTICSV